MECPSLLREQVREVREQEVYCSSSRCFLLMNEVFTVLVAFSLFSSAISFFFFLPRFSLFLSSFLPFIAAYLPDFLNRPTP